MDFHQLKIFMEVARQKNFSRAAENVFLTQPTVSARIKSLEDEIGTLLLDRSQRELQLTAAGKVLFKYAQQLLGIKEEALAAIQNEYRVIKGHLEIASSSVPGAYLLPVLLRSFHREYPETTFSVRLCDTRQVLQSMQDYTYDLGFVGEPGEKEGLGQIELVEDELILIAPSGTVLPAVGKERSPLPQVEFSSCLDRPFVMREPGSATRQVFEKALKKHPASNKSMKVIAYLESQEAIKEAVKAGLGLTVISQKAVQDELQAGSIKGYKLLDLELKRNFYLIFWKNRVLPPLSQAFLDFTVKYFFPNTKKPLK